MFKNPIFFGVKAIVGIVQTGRRCFAGSVQSRSKHKNTGKTKVKIKGVHNKSFKPTALRAAA
ncbi:hypothetical protein RNAN_3781 [Rheinheimera nanhaiensis E407-8]|uniref:Uncharacterized protein n=1 Tax=Rheinheimera nanhaiensis E407-8 TaxID=562729 RepID=I1E376_9GAMM|nr:hypothetical protein RNAN_3781 [Rheinheimera nanhaiensis E407-8]